MPKPLAKANPLVHNPDYLCFLLYEIMFMLEDAKRSGGFDSEQLNFWMTRTKEYIGYDQENRHAN